MLRSLLIILVFTGPASAQTAYDVLPGARVRLVAPTQWLVPREGTLVTTRGDTVFVRYGRNQPVVPTPFTHIESYRVVRDRLHLGREAGLTGIVVGALGGALVGLISCDCCCDDGERLGQAGMFASLSGGLAGLLGWIIGSTIPRARWMVII